MRRITLLLVAVFLCMAQSGHRPEPPKFLRTHGIYSAHSEMFLQVKIVPHPDIRSITVEAWELERRDVEPDENGTVSDFEMPIAPKRIGNRPVRLSREDVAPRQATYPFTWRAGLDVGDYELVATVALRGGGQIASAPKIILVR